MCNHETFIHSIRDLAVSRLNPQEQARVKACKLVYGAGSTSLRGVTYYNSWKQAGDSLDLAEICALGESDFVQLAGTTLHELGHVLAGPGTGHSKAWKEACRKLGLRCIKAAGTRYSLALFEPSLRMAIAGLKKPDDGLPWTYGSIVPAMPIRPCSQGTGTRGGTSRGPGSGSRLRLWQCECVPPVKVRVASSSFRARCECCDSSFKQPH